MAVLRWDAHTRTTKFAFYSRHFPDRGRGVGCHHATSGIEGVDLVPQVGHFKTKTRQAKKVVSTLSGEFQALNRDQSGHAGCSKKLQNLRQKGECEVLGPEEAIKVREKADQRRCGRLMEGRCSMRRLRAAAAVGLSSAAMSLVHS